VIDTAKTQEPTVADRPAGRPRRLSGRAIALGLILLALICVPATYSVLTTYSYVLQLMTTGFMWIALASSWNILGGFTGYISLGHNVFLAVGAYLSGYLLVYNGVSPFVTAILAGLVCVVLGAVVGLITLRTRGDAFIIATIALMLVARIAFDNWDLIGGTNGLSLPALAISDPALTKVPFYYVMLLIAVLAVLLAHRIAHSKLGLGLRAIAQDEVKAEVAGIDTRMYKIAAYALSGFFIGVAGSMWGYSLSYLRPEIFLTLAVAADMMLMTVLGGRGTVAGPVLGAVLIVAFNEVSVSKLGASELNLALTGVLLVAVLLLFPTGIVGSLRARRRLPRILDWD
jgi:branched-chain amino acid transport system permease protein